MNREQFGHRMTVHARTMAGTLAVALIVVGIQIFMVTYSMVVFSETPRPARKGRHRYMVINLLLFLISTLATILVFTRYFTLWWDADGPLDYAQRRHGQAVWATLFNNIAGNFTICLGDALLLYRCYIVWADRKWVMIVPTVTYIAALVMCLVLTVADIKTHGGANLALWVALLSLSIALNIMVTGLIAGRLIHSQRRIAKLLDGNLVSESVSGFNRNITGASAIVIESALPLTLMALGSAVMQGLEMKEFGNDPRIRTRIMIAGQVFTSLYTAFVVLSPQMIIFRVTMGRSWITGVHKTFTSGTSRKMPGIVFADSGGETTQSLDDHLSCNTANLERPSSRSSNVVPENEKESKV